MELAEEISSANDEKMYTVGVFIDLKKAFDTIDHNLLIQKLQHFGIRGGGGNQICGYPAIYRTGHSLLTWMRLTRIYIKLYVEFHKGLF